MQIKRAYKYRLYPNIFQRKRLTLQFGATRFVYNYFLNQRIEHYKATGKGLNYNETTLILTQLKKQMEFKWLGEAYAQSLQQSLRDLDKAYINFFNQRAGFPSFKKKYGKQSYRIPRQTKLDNKKLYIPKVGWVKIILDRPVEGRIKNLTISKTKSGKYFVSLQVEQEIENPIYEGEEIGLDLGLKDFAITSEGKKFPNPKFFQRSEKKLARLQYKLSKTKKGSQGRERARLKVARQYEKVANQRKDFLHKLSHNLVTKNRVIVLEDLDIKSMVQNPIFSKGISDVSWAEFIRQLTYKGKWYGCEIHKLDQFFPSSKCCSHCGHINQDLKLSERKWICPNCGVVLDRDINAAQNLLKKHTVGTTGINAGGQNVRPDNDQAVWSKPEASKLARARPG